MRRLLHTPPRWLELQGQLGARVGGNAGKWEPPYTLVGV